MTDRSHWKYYSSMNQRGSRTTDEMLADASAAGRDLDMPPLTRLVAKSVEIRMSFFAGEIQHALVAAAEFLELLEANCGFDDPDFPIAQVHALLAQDVTISAAHDSATVPLDAIRDLIDGFETFLRVTDRPTLVADQKRAKHAAILGDYDEAQRLVESSLPQVGHLSSTRLGYGCPNCSLGGLLGALPRGASPSLLKEYLRPVFSGNEGYPIDPPALVTRLREHRGGSLECESGRTTCQTILARCLIHHGELEEAEHYLRRALERHNYGCFLLPEVAVVEWAMASDAAEELAREADALFARSRTHEDIAEAYWGALCVAQAFAKLGRADAEVEAATNLTYRFADQLDARLPVPRWRTHCETEFAPL